MEYGLENGISPKGHFSLTQNTQFQTQNEQSISGILANKIQISVENNSIL